ncbi:AAA family ATPase [Lentzea sp. BCCO 10_0856]|uniref:AAA family ATPase n=1 Tax=Lentzea miocenica TaxID=3095431 RepID=A0ABU4T5Q2_9PSEU|nr:AAA family ATPase [Lentzea sp. BCCO 10_0856]MDX8033483.1 AAA family ATPase [Lentzea sp. BCCO 10_0856]
MHEQLAKMMKANKFEPFIRYIRFPYFRNIREGTQIDFTHPVTVLVGPNGTNKTAMLRALQGCPDTYNVGNYWFSTDLDPIEGTSNHRFIHGYVANSTGEMVEAIKMRIKKPDNPDYFEPSRPIVRDGMSRLTRLKSDAPVPPERTQTRWKAIPKKVTYLDFRSELSAYDKFFYHLPYRPGSTSAVNTEKKAFIRRRSPHVAHAFASGLRSHHWYGAERIVKSSTTVTEEQCTWISDILGRKYEQIRFLTHRYFNVEGSTVILSAFGMKYSEAFAGSGEFAVSMMVKKVTEAPNNSLILLDEPEVSLHPGAQRRLMEFLANQSKTKGHQIVISTHSPEIVQGLPANAIKVFHVSEADGKVDLLSNESDPSEAFFRLGVRLTNKKTVYVEDRLAVALVKKAIRPLGESASLQLHIAALPGGANGMQARFVPAFALSGTERSLVLLDGDQQPNEKISDPANVADADLESVVRAQLGSDPQLALNGSNGVATEGDKTKQLRTVLEWLCRHVDYLPGQTPEELLIEMKDLVVDADAKDYWKSRTYQALDRAVWETVNSDEIFAEQERALGSIDDNDPMLECIRARMRAFLQED